MTDNDLIDIIKQIIKDETENLKHYIGRVTNNVDPLNKGRVSVVIPERGWITNDLALWCWPRQTGMSIPSVNSWVEVYFINGNVNRAVYLKYASEMKDQNPSSFDGKPACHILFEDPITKENIKFDSDTKELVFLEGTESFIKGDTAKAELQKIVDMLTQLQTDFTGWTPVSMDGGLALKTILTSGFLTKMNAVLTNILSINIKGK